MEAASPVSAGSLSQLEPGEWQAAVDPGRADVPFKDLQMGEFPYPGEGQAFVLFSPSSDWMRLSHIMEVNLLYSNLPV